MEHGLCHLEYTVHTVQLHGGRKEAPTSASGTLWANIHTRRGYTELHMSNHLSTDVYLQMVGVRRVCANVLILFAFASLSVYRSLTAVGILHIRAVTHQSCYLWLIFMAEPVCLVTEPGPITTGIQVHVHLQKKEPRGRATNPYRVWSFGFLCVRFKRSCLTLVFGWDEQTLGDLRRQVESMLGAKASPRPSVKSFLTQGSHVQNSGTKEGNSHLRMSSDTKKKPNPAARAPN